MIGKVFMKKLGKYWMRIIIYLLILIVVLRYEDANYYFDKIYHNSSLGIELYIIKERE